MSFKFLSAFPSYFHFHSHTSPFRIFLKTLGVYSERLFFFFWEGGGGKGKFPKRCISELKKRVSNSSLERGGFQREVFIIMVIVYEHSRTRMMYM